MRTQWFFDGATHTTDHHLLGACITGLGDIGSGTVVGDAANGLFCYHAHNLSFSLPVPILFQLVGTAWQAHLYDNYFIDYQNIPPSLLMATPQPVLYFMPHFEEFGSIEKLTGLNKTTLP